MKFYIGKQFDENDVQLNLCKFNEIARLQKAYKLKIK